MALLTNSLKLGSLSSSGETPLSSAGAFWSSLSPFFFVGGVWTIPDGARGCDEQSDEWKVVSGRTLAEGRRCYARRQYVRGAKQAQGRVLLE